MKGSTWNCLKSIPVDDLSEAELKEAIHEWAEGHDSFEELLWLCYNNGIKTNGCCAGDHHFAYVDFLLDEGKEKLLEMMSAAWKYGKINFFCQFYGNPRSGSDWYKTCLLEKMLMQFLFLVNFVLHLLVLQILNTIQSFLVKLITPKWKIQTSRLSYGSLKLRMKMLWRTFLKLHWKFLRVNGQLKFPANLMKGWALTRFPLSCVAYYDVFSCKIYFLLTKNDKMWIN